MKNFKRLYRNVSDSIVKRKYIICFLEPSNQMKILRRIIYLPSFNDDFYYHRVNMNGKQSFGPPVNRSPRSFNRENPFTFIELNNDNEPDQSNYQIFAYNSTLWTRVLLFSGYSSQPAFALPSYSVFLTFQDLKNYIEQHVISICGK